MTQNNKIIYFCQYTETFYRYCCGKQNASFFKIVQFRDILTY